MWNKIKLFFEKKVILKIILIFWIIFSIFIIHTNAQLVDLGSLSWLSNIQKNTITKTWTWDIVKDTEDFGLSILLIVKVILEWILVIYIVYIWWTMIMSMWSDDAKLTNAKNQQWIEDHV